MIDRIYFTRILETLECDAFLPGLPEEFGFVASLDSPYAEISDKRIHEEKGLRYQFEFFNLPNK